MRPSLTRAASRSFLPALAVLLCLAACVSKPAAKPAPSGQTSIKLDPKDQGVAPDAAAPSPAQADSAPTPRPDARGLSLTARIEREVAFASPSSLSAAEELIRANKAQDSEFGRAVLYAIHQLRRRLYPESLDQDAKLDPPALNALVKVVQETEKGRYPDSALRSSSPFAAFLSTTVLFAPQDAQIARSAMADLERLVSEGLSTLLLPYFAGLQAERAKDWPRALAEFAKAEALSAECYPASLGRARALFGLGRKDEAVALLEALAAVRPESLAVSRLLAQAYYESGRHGEASPLIQAVLRAEPTNEAFIAMRAHILILAGNYLQAGPLLDAYATRNPRDPLYLYLRGLYTWKEEKQRAKAIRFLEGAAALYPRDARLSLLLAEILLEGGEPSSEERQTARGLLESLLAVEPGRSEAIILLARDALAVGDSARALACLDALLAADPSFRDYALMTEIAFAAKQAKRASAWAEAWFAAAPADEAAALAKARALLESGQSAQALALIDERLSKRPAAKYSSDLYYLRSRLQKDREAAMGDLRSSLMDDPRNLDAILAMFDAYFSQKDYKKAQYYLRQAQAAAPASAQVASRANILGSLASQ